MEMRFFANRKKAFGQIAEIALSILLVTVFCYATATREYPDWGGFWVQIFFLALGLIISFIKREGINSLDTVVISPDGLKRRNWFKTTTIRWDDIERLGIREVGEPYSGFGGTRYKTRICIKIGGREGKNNTYEEMLIDNRDDVIDCIGRFYDLPHDFCEDTKVGDFRG